MINPDTAENRITLKDILVGAGFDDKKVKRAIGYPVPIGFALNSQQPTGGGGEGPVIDGDTWRNRESLIELNPEPPGSYFESDGQRFLVDLILIAYSDEADVKMRYDASTLESLDFMLFESPDYNGNLIVYDEAGGLVDFVNLLDDMQFVYEFPETAFTFEIVLFASSLESLPTRIVFQATPKTAPANDGAFEVRIDGKPVPVMVKSEGQMLLSYNEGSNILDPHKCLHVGSLVEVLSTVPWSMEFIYNTNQRFTKKGGATLEDADDPQPNGKFRLPVPPPWPQLPDGLEVDKTSS